MPTSTCGCGCGSTGQPCGQGPLERPRYFPRQLITPVELTLEQQYFRHRMRRHNRFLHGWGVACGAQVCMVIDAATHAAQPWMVTVQPGYVLGPEGDEILIDHPQTIDLRSAGASAMSDDDAASGAGDPWCTQVLAQPAAGPLFVAVRYQETMGRQVRVQPAGCGCDDAQCEYSRWRDGFEIGVLSACPSTNQAPPSFDNLFRNAPAPDCPDCPSSPWVALAQVTVDATGTVQAIDDSSCRRQLVSWCDLWWQAAPQAVQINVDPIDNVIPGNAFSLTARTPQTVPADLTADLGAGVEVTQVVVTPPPGNTPGTTVITISAQADSQAQPGPRPLTLGQKNGCILATVPNAFTVQAAAVVDPRKQPFPQPAPDQAQPLPQPTPSPQPAPAQAQPLPQPNPLPQPAPTQAQPAPQQPAAQPSPAGAANPAAPSNPAAPPSPNLQSPNPAAPPLAAAATDTAAGAAPRAIPAPTSAAPPKPGPPAPKTAAPARTPSRGKRPPQNK